MKLSLAMKIFFLIFLFLFSLQLFSQTEQTIVSKNNIEKLNFKIKDLEQKYKKSNLPNLHSLPQTVGHYFQIETANPDAFLKVLKNIDDINKLINSFPNLRIDRDLLVIKSDYTDYNKNRKVKLKSFEIGNNDNHKVDLNFEEYSKQKNSKIVFKNKYWEYRKKNMIKGFFLLKPFEVTKIPTKYSDWVLYSDILTNPKEAVFFENKNKTPRYKPTVIDTMVQYYATKTNKPIYDKNNYQNYRKKLNTWTKNKKRLSDSLYKNDTKFKLLLNKSLIYAKKENVSNGELEFYVANSISKKEALNLIRNNQKVGSCSYDNSPNEQLKQIARLSADTGNWSVFIKSFLNVMNDYTDRIASSNIAEQARKTYIEELSKLDININKLLLGSNVKVYDTINKHYFSSSSKVGKAYTSLSKKYQEQFEEKIITILKDKKVDAFNKLNFYNMLISYRFYISDTIHKEKVTEKINAVIKYLPYEIASRIKNPNKELFDLLYNERDELKKFTLKKSIIAHITSGSFEGDCWDADLEEKNNPKIAYNLTMLINKKITPFKNFLDKKTTIDKRIANNKLIQNLLKKDVNSKLHVIFINNKSLTDKKIKRILEETPNDFVKELNFTEGIYFYIKYPKRRTASFVLLNNNDILMLEIPKGYTIPNYTFEELTSEIKKKFSFNYKSYKLINNDGEIIKP